MIFSYLLNMQSHPSWVCGLKLHLQEEHKQNNQSHPSWVCGLKQRLIFITSINKGHILRGCVD